MSLDIIRIEIFADLCVLLNSDQREKCIKECGAGITAFLLQEKSNQIEDVLRKLLVTYEFLSGRIKMNPETSRFEFDCNNAGVGFVVARSKLALNEIGDLVYPNPAFSQLVTQGLDSLSPDSHPLCIFQMTAFKCGGFSMGVLTNHTLFDGGSTKFFTQNLAALACDKPLAMTPCNNRELLAARSPPTVSFPHPELLKLSIPLTAVAAANANPSVFDNSIADLDFKVFHLTPDDLLHLKLKTMSSSSTGNARFTSFNVVSAHIWRCKALSSDYENNPEKDSTLLYAVDIRQRLNPPLPAEYTGNAVLTAYATAKCREIEKAPLSRLIEMVAEGVSRMTDEYVRSAIDFGEEYKMFPKGDFMITSWWRLGFDEMEYPWGKAIYSCPISRRKDIILLLPDITNFASGGKGGGGAGGGVNVWVTLPRKEMTKFESSFYKYLA
ncbi:hypothetical protein Droror1_Dr00025578 [Drosera rotundifolia]